jgi:N-methylhydantoinase B/oxoprolinase/acetone carboxylase alpha subunit
MNTPLDRLKHHVSGAIERGEKEALVKQRSRLATNEMAMAQLEWLIDTHGLKQVLQAVRDIMDEKAEHVRANWQDEALALQIDKNAIAVGNAAERIRE